MANNGLISPLNLEAGAGLLQNTGINVGADLTDNVAAYEATTVVSKLLAIQTYLSTANVSLSNQTALQTLGNTTCPALGDSTPSAYFSSTWPGSSTKLFANSTSLFSGAISTVASTYLGSGDVGKFAQAYFASQGYIGLVNPFINSAVNANSTDYLGPTFAGSDSLVSGDLAQVNLAYTTFGADLQNLGQMIDLANLDNFGSPAALLQQLSKVGNMTAGTLPAIRTALNEAGLTYQDIQNLITNNVESLFNPDGLPVYEFNALQKRAYPALCTIQGTDLQDVLDILEVTTPNIAKMCELLNPVKLLPNSYPSLTIPTPGGLALVYNANGDINSAVAQIIDTESLAPVGCEELGKIVPPANSVGSKAIIVALSQVKNVRGMTLPQLAAALV